MRRRALAALSLPLVLALALAGLGTWWLRTGRLPIAAGATWMTVQKTTTADATPQPGKPVFKLIEDVDLFPAPPAEDPDVCCTHHYEDAYRHPSVIEDYQKAQDAARKLLTGPIVMMGEELRLFPSRFIVDENRIHVVSDKAMKPVHFAACQNSMVDSGVLIGVSETVANLQPLVPPILFDESQECVRLLFDFFQNSWGVGLESKQVPIPALLTDLRERGMEKDVTVVVWGEFGRTPKINKDAGRDHWARVNSVLMTGGGMKTGQVIGSTGSDAGEAKDDPIYYPSVLATVSLENGTAPVINSSNVSDSEYTSLFGSSPMPCACSGDA